MLSMNHEHHMYRLSMNYEHHTYRLSLNHEHHTYRLSLNHEHHTYSLSMNHEHHTYRLSMNYEHHTYRLCMNYEHNTHTSAISTRLVMLQKLTELSIGMHVPGSWNIVYEMFYCTLIISLFPSSLQRPGGHVEFEVLGCPLCVEFSPSFPHPTLYGYSLMVCEVWWVLLFTPPPPDLLP